MKGRNRALTIFGPVLVLLIGTGPSFLWASGKTQGALTLLESPSARASALGEAFVSQPDDISAVHYNPALLETLHSGQASILYQEGALEDTFGQIMIGHPNDRGSIGLNIGIYDGGKADFYDGQTLRTVTAQRDMLIAASYATDFNELSVGGTIKYFSSELAEEAKADAFAVDLGLDIPVNARWRVGASMLNFGTPLSYRTKPVDMPMSGRLGASYLVRPGQVSVSVLGDVSYMVNTAEIQPSLGIETWMGPLAIRAGYKYGSDLEEFSIGTGFVMGRTSLDYSFGMVDQFDSRHRVSVSMYFGRIIRTPAFVLRQGDEASPDQFATARESKSAKPISEKPIKRRYDPIVVNYESKPGSLAKHDVYEIKPGDNLRSIAKEHYGREDLWTLIFNANNHILNSPDDFEPGQRILLPKRVQ